MIEDSSHPPFSPSCSPSVATIDINSVAINQLEQVLAESKITRNMLDNMLPGLPYVPMQAVCAAPMVVLDDQILALGEHVLADGVDVFRSFGPNALI